MQKCSHQILLVFVSLIAGLMQAGKAENISTNASADFEWFSRLGFPDVAGCPYIRVSTGQWGQMGSGPRQNQYLDAFLLNTNSVTFRILTLDLSDETLTNSVTETDDYQQVGYSRLNFKNEAKLALQLLQHPVTNQDDFARFGKALTERTETFVLAWACWRQGLNNEAEDLYYEALKMGGGRQYDTNSLRESLEKNLAYATMWHAVVCFGEPSISRPQLLAMFTAIATNYPESEYHDRAVQTADMLRRMIVEDRAHGTNGPSNLDHLPVQARISELIYRLRDQNGHQYSQPGFCDIFDRWHPGNTNTPAHQLVKLGYAAVPQLIAALDDQTFSRSVGYWRNFTFSHNVLTVGDCAEAILQRITGRSFFVPTYTSSYMSKDKKATATRKAAEAWWAEFQTKGEKQMLVAAIVSPGNDAPAEAEIIRQRYPEVAVTALMRGIQATTNDWIRSQLVREIGKIDQPAAIDFLRQEMTNSPILQSRVAAAYGLRRVDKDASVAAMIQEWLKFDAVTADLLNGGSELIDFLAGSNSPDAIRALAHDIRRRNVNIRLTVVDDTDSIGLQSFVTNSPATSAAIEDFLVKELEDTEECAGTSGFRDGIWYYDPRVCDFAGEILAQRYTNRYAFGLSASVNVRDLQRLQCINAWRKAQHLPQLPLPANTAVHVLPHNATVVTSVEWEDGSEKPNAKFAKMVAAFKGAPLNSTAIIKLLTHYSAAPENPSAGFYFKAVKDGDLTGVKIHVRLLPGKQLSNQDAYDFTEHVTLGDQCLLQSAGGAGSDSFGEPEGWSDFADAINRALSGSPQTPFEVGMQIKIGSADQH